MAINSREIDYVLLVKNANEMIHLLEFDSMRSPGKMKLNAPQLDALYSNKDRYAKLIQAPAKKKEG